MAPEIEDLEKAISAFDRAKEKLEGYIHDCLPLPTTAWTKEEIINEQRKAVSNTFDTVIFKAMALERINALPVELSETIAQMQK